MMQRQRRKVLEDSHNHERWLISYADFMTLLFGFFVVMYAISSVNEGKYKVLSSALNEVFAQRDMTLAPIQVGETAQSSSPSIVDAKDSVTAKDIDPGDTYLESMATEVQKRLAGVLGKGEFDVKGNDQWLEINLDAGVSVRERRCIVRAARERRAAGSDRHARRREESGDGRGIYRQRADRDRTIRVELGTLGGTRRVGGARVRGSRHRSGSARGSGLRRATPGGHQRNA